MKRRDKDRAARGIRAVELEILVEEESAGIAVKDLVHRVVADAQVTVRIRQFRGKPDLLKKLPARLRGYAAARDRGDDVRILVLLDKDDDDCRNLKANLDSIAMQAGLTVKGKQGGEFCVLNRIAVRELESWYFGDWRAVRKAFPKIPVEPPKRFRGNPDCVDGKPSEAFNRVLRGAGVRMTAKTMWGQRIGPHLDPDRNNSMSFRAFIDGLREIVRDDTR
ncbi:DUF4276 family protein [Streptomyces sp. AJS327]|uniref:DUF4276 family protein n=1 Tax=Streptomyces sp. AJS327 TaxID=2545265 RepID=UPI0015E0141F|nr:DUF4276 family protein [Streptomyces sp. AJS327]MBA0051721.1 DUF4276 family protein [Streptomyces sp. AJS327]